MIVFPGRNLHPCSIRRHLPCFAVTLIALLAVSVATAEPNAAVPARETVSRLQDGLLNIDGRNAAAGMERRFAAFAPLIDSTHDLQAMARVSLGPRWQNLTVDQQQLFSASFRRLSILDYAQRFRDTQGAVFQNAAAVDTGPGRVSISTEMKAPAEDAINLVYVLHATPEGWRIVNIVADGVSELSLQRAQYQKIMKAAGFDGLMKHMEKRIATAAGQ